MKMKRIYCHTNLDLFNEEWPKELPEIPRKGDEIQSIIRHGQFRLTLTVVAVRWSYSHTGYFPKIELHTSANTSIKSFYEGYAPAVGKNVGAFI